MKETKLKKHQNKLKYNTDTQRYPTGSAKTRDTDIQCYPACSAKERGLED